MPKFPIERVVTVLAPLYAAANVALAGWIAKQTGVHADPGALAAVEVGAFIGTIGIIAKWVHGRQIPEIAQLGISQTQIDEVRKEAEAWLHAHQGTIEHDADLLVEAVVARLKDGAAPTVAAS